METCRGDRTRTIAAAIALGATIAVSGWAAAGEPEIVAQQGQQELQKAEAGRREMERAAAAMMEAEKAAQQALEKAVAARKIFERAMQREVEKTEAARKELENALAEREVLKKAAQQEAEKIEAARRELETVAAARKEAEKAAVAGRELGRIAALQKDIETIAMVPNGQEARYLLGLELERRGELRAAMEMYKEAAESDNRFAQRKLGDIYGTGNAAVERDYQTSLKWYRRAQTDGLEIPNRPFTFPGVRR